MIKKVIVLLVAMLLVFSSLSIAQGDLQQQNEAAKRLVALKLLQGYEDGSLKLENPIKRSEFATLAVRLIGKESEVEKSKGTTIFKDVKKDHWASGYINIAVREGLVNGYGDNTFKPENNITNAEVLALLVRLLGYESSVSKEEVWPVNYVNAASKLGISNNPVIVADAQATRGDVVYFVDRSLLVKLNKQY